MTKNSLAALRKAKKITRAQLGKAVGLSAEHIHLIENGYTVNLGYAKDVARALNEPLTGIFPAAAKFGDNLSDPANVEELESLGLDADEMPNWFRFVLKNGVDRTVLISGGERRWLERALESELSGFVEFNTAMERIAINRAYLSFWQFHDFGGETFDLSSFADQPTFKLWLAHSKEPVSMGVDHDDFDRDDPDVGRALQTVFLSLEDLDYPQCVYGTDGEVLYFKKPDVAMLSVDLAAVEPELIEGLRDDDCDDDELDEAA